MKHLAYCPRRGHPWVILGVVGLAGLGPSGFACSSNQPVWGLCTKDGLVLAGINFAPQNGACSLTSAQRDAGTAVCHRFDAGATLTSTGSLADVDAQSGTFRLKARVEATQGSIEFGGKQVLLISVTGAGQSILFTDRPGADAGPTTGSLEEGITQKVLQSSSLSNLATGAGLGAGAGAGIGFALTRPNKFVAKRQQTKAVRSTSAANDPGIKTVEAKSKKVEKSRYSLDDLSFESAELSKMLQQQQAAHQEALRYRGNPLLNESYKQKRMAKRYPGSITSLESDANESVRSSVNTSNYYLQKIKNNQREIIDVSKQNASSARAKSVSVAEVGRSSVNSGLTPKRLTSSDNSSSGRFTIESNNLLERSDLSSIRSSSRGSSDRGSNRVAHFVETDSVPGAGQSQRTSGETFRLSEDLNSSSNRGASSRSSTTSVLAGEIDNVAPKKPSALTTAKKVATGAATGAAVGAGIAWAMQNFRQSFCDYTTGISRPDNNGAAYFACFSKVDNGVMKFFNAFAYRPTQSSHCQVSPDQVNQLRILCEAGGGYLSPIPFGLEYAVKEWPSAFKDVDTNIKQWASQFRGSSVDDGGNPVQRAGQMSSGTDNGIFSAYSLAPAQIAAKEAEELATVYVQ